MLHSSNQHFLCGSELIVDHKTQTKDRFESLKIVFLPKVPGSKRKSSLHYLLSEL